MSHLKANLAGMFIGLFSTKWMGIFCVDQKSKKAATPITFLSIGPYGKTN